MRIMERYSRRRFLGTAAETAALGALGLALRPLSAIASSDVPQITFYDPRFESAQALAAALAGVGRLLPTHGDPTSLLLGLIAPGPGRVAPRLKGVTTESIPFCLQQWLPGRRLDLHRIDRDLFVWHLEGS